MTEREGERGGGGGRREGETDRQTDGGGVGRRLMCHSGNRHGTVAWMTWTLAFVVKH